jgi:hypothetical protein
MKCEPHGQMKIVLVTDEGQIQAKATGSCKGCQDSFGDVPQLAVLLVTDEAAGSVVQPAARGCSQPAAASYYLSRKTEENVTLHDHGFSCQQIMLL